MNRDKQLTDTCIYRKYALILFSILLLNSICVADELALDSFPENLLVTSNYPAGYNPILENSNKIPVECNNEFCYSDGIPAFGKSYNPLLLPTSKGGNNGPILLTDTATDRSTAYAMSNKIISILNNESDLTFFAFSKNDGEVPFKRYKTMSTWVACYDNKKEKIISETLVGYQDDNHGSPAIVIDNEGYLHIAFGPHGKTSLSYSRSKYPYNSTEWEEIESVNTRPSGEKNNLTYPIINIDSLNNIHIAGSNIGFATYLKKNRDQSWSEPKIIMKEFKELYARYNVNMEIDRFDTVHILVPRLELLTGENDSIAKMELFYLKSEDYGETFSKPLRIWNVSDGYAYYNTLSIDDNGNVHITLIERNDGSPEKCIWYIHNDGGNWIKDKIIVPFKNVWEAKNVINPDGNLYIVAQVSNNSNFNITDEKIGWYDPSNEIILIQLKKSGSWGPPTYEKIVKSDNNVAWLPTIEKFNNKSQKWFWLMWNEGPLDYNSTSKNSYVFKNYGRRIESN